jgi:hypothetical protein
MCKIIDLSERRERRSAPRCEVCGLPGGYGASLLVCGPCRGVEALCGYDLGLAAAVVERLGPGLAAELVTASWVGALRSVAAP